MEPGLIIAVLVVVGAGVVLQLRRRHSGVPLKWSTSQSVAARLHRRAHAAVDGASKQVRQLKRRGFPVDYYEGLVQDLRAQAIALDGRLVAASRLPLAQRHKVLFDLRWRVIELEKLCHRTARVALDAQSPDVAGADHGIDGIRQRLDSLDAARRELREL